jgi:hypothetical protein
MLMRPVWWRWVLTFTLFALVIVWFSHGGFGWFIVIFGVALLLGLFGVVIAAAVSSQKGRK